MKGIVLAGGSGTRLYPLTKFTSKQLLSVYDKPLIYYPLSTLMLGGITDIALISTPVDIPKYKELLGNGENWGLTLTYFTQEKSRGIAEAFIICKDFIGNNHVSMILGDNIFYGNMRLTEVFGGFNGGALVFAYPVQDPQRYGVIELDSNGNAVGIDEKPKEPKSKYAVTGLYIYDSKSVEYAENLTPSDRGELEITDLNMEYLERGELKVNLLSRGIAWIDAGTVASLQQAGSFVQSIEDRQFYKIGCPEEIALRMGFIDLNRFASILSGIPDCEYRDYLTEIYKEFND